MPELSYHPQPHDQESFLRRAASRPGFQEAYDELQSRYALIRELLFARTKAGLTQEDVATLMGTTKSAISRLEASSKHSPSVTTLERYAKAVGCHLEIRLVEDA